MPWVGVSSAVSYRTCQMFLFVESMRALSLRCATVYLGLDGAYYPAGSDLRRAQKMPARCTSGISVECFVFCWPFCFCGILGLRLPPEVGMSSSTMSPVRRSCVPGPVFNRMAHLVNVPSQDISCHSIAIFLDVHILSSLPAPLCYYPMHVHNECIVHHVSIVLHLRSLPIPIERERESTLVVIIINSHYYALDFLSSASIIITG
jgi:hypothetical protein